METTGYLKLAVGNGYYVYDTTTNALIELEESVHRVLDDYFKYNPAQLRERYLQQISPDDLSHAVDFLDHAVHQCGMFQPYTGRDYATVLSSDRIQTLLSMKLRNLLLNVTEQCNQRCTYCVYSGKHIGERTHSPKQMTWDVAKKSIDYFLARADRDNETRILFYGGEPLLNWTLVKKCTHYIRRLNTLAKLKLHLSSNITLLSDLVVDFLIDNDIGLFVSLDGPARVHDKGRVFANGLRTHAKVVQRLEHIKKKDYTYFLSRISINCTFDNNNDILEIFQYFSSDIFAELPVQINPIKKSDTDSIKILNRDLNQHRSRMNRLVSMYMKSLQFHESFNYRLFHNIFPDVFKILPKRNIGHVNMIGSPNGVCVPGQRNLFVSADGSYYTCENFCYPGYEIGNCENGIDINKVRDLLRISVNFCIEMCESCWAYRLCSQCFIHASHRGRISRRARLENCRFERKRIKRALERFIYIWGKESEIASENEFTLHSIVGSNQS